MGSILGGEDPLEKERAVHSSVLAWRVPWTGEPGGLQSVVPQGGAGLKGLSLAPCEPRRQAGLWKSRILGREQQPLAPPRASCAWVFLLRTCPCERWAGFLLCVLQC